MAADTMETTRPREARPQRPPPRPPQRQQLPQSKQPHPNQQQRQPRPPPPKMNGEPHPPPPRMNGEPPRRPPPPRMNGEPPRPPPPRMNGEPPLSPKMNAAPRPQGEPRQQLRPQGEPRPQKPVNGEARPPSLQKPPTNVEFNPASIARGIRQADGSVSSGTEKNHSDEWVEINDDVYNMFFLSNIGGQAFWYGIYIFVLKLALYTFLAMDAIDLEQPSDVSEPVLVTQFFMLPVAVAMQDDLIATYFLVANIKYSPLIKIENPHATKWKFHVANLCRGMDGMYSLFVNFVILIKATEVLSLFLNFAALQFLQTLDNIALRLCADGYLTERLEEVANHVMTARLPNKNNKLYRSMDSILFLSTFIALLISWAVISFA